MRYDTLIATSLLGALLAPSSGPAAVPAQIRQEPVYLVTAADVPFEEMIDPALVSLLKKYGVAVALAVRQDQLDESLDRLYSVYDQAGVRILLWPLLPREHGLYLNKRTTRIYRDYLDEVYEWADETGHVIDAIVVDVEPSFVEPPPGEEPPGIWEILYRFAQEMDRETFQASIPEFNAIIDSINHRGSLAIAAAFPFVIEDKQNRRHGWEDLFGGPIATVDWDHIAIMMYTTWFVDAGSAIGIDWDAAHYLAYDYARDLKRLWGDDAAVAVGVTNPGPEGSEIVLYETPEQIAPAIAAVKAAGIERIGIFDMRGILQSGDVEPWFQALVETQPAVPSKGKWAAKMVRWVVGVVGVLLELVR